MGEGMGEREEWAQRPLPPPPCFSLFPSSLFERKSGGGGSSEKGGKGKRALLLFSLYGERSLLLRKGSSKYLKGLAVGGRDILATNPIGHIGDKTYWRQTQKQTHWRHPLRTYWRQYCVQSFMGEEGKRASQIRL